MVSIRFARLCTFGILMGAIALCSLADGAPPPPPKNLKNKNQPQAQKNAQRPQLPGVPATPLNGKVMANGLPAGGLGVGGATAAKTISNGLTPVAKTSTKTVDKEVEFAVADDVQVQQLAKMSGGLNYAPAKFEDVKEGQKVTLSLVAKGDDKSVVQVSGTLVKLSEGGKKVTLMVTLPMDQEAPDGAGKQVAQLSIRSLPESN